MAVCDIADIGKVEHVVVVADLELGLALAIRRHHLWQELDIAFAKDAGGSDRARQELLWLAIRFEDSGLSESLTLSVL